jgi:RecG-like helicase
MNIIILLVLLTISTMSRSLEFNDPGHNNAISDHGSPLALWDLEYPDLFQLDPNHPNNPDNTIQAIQESNSYNQDFNYLKQDNNTDELVSFPPEQIPNLSGYNNSASYPPHYNVADGPEYVEVNSVQVPIDDYNNQPHYIEDDINEIFGQQITYDAAVEVNSNPMTSVNYYGNDPHDVYQANNESCQPYHPQYVEMNTNQMASGNYYGNQPYYVYQANNENCQPNVANQAPYVEMNSYQMASANYSNQPYYFYPSNSAYSQSYAANGPQYVAINSNQIISPNYYAQKTPLQNKKRRIANSGLIPQGQIIATSHSLLPNGVISNISVFSPFVDNTPTLEDFDSTLTESKTRKTRPTPVNDKYVSKQLKEVIKGRSSQSTDVINVNELAFENFNNDFPYNLTTCQSRAMQEIQADFLSGKPMSRVLVGSVGYGKTEIALRTTFLIAQSKKQIVIIAPTKTLAHQHFDTFSKRFLPTGLKVVLVPPGRKGKKFLNDLEDGTADIIIGTHAALSDKIIYKNIGYIIIDEEQKFSVKQKAMLQAKFNNAHVLWMTATPIPRTMKLIKKKLMTMSQLITPPRGRLPVISGMINFSNQDLRMVIDPELNRGGQVFITIPHISDIDENLNKVKALYPNISVAFAHGKMPKNQLDIVLKRFRDGDIKILLATTILEVGIDVPNANTIIIFNPTQLGIATLSQLRGRVGRSDKQAYCYIAKDPEDEIKNGATLGRWQEFISNNQLGDDYKLSELDEQRRGAGVLFGNHQTGKGQWRQHK